MRYKIEHKISTLAENAATKDGGYDSFTTEGVSFSQWDFTQRDGWRGDAWLAMKEIDTINYKEAYRQFQLDLQKIVPRLSFVGQCYVASRQQPFLITKEASDIAFFHYVKERGPVGLIFMDKELKALEALLQNAAVPSQFFYYWGDIVNSTGYTPKLLLMFSAFESLVKDSSGRKDWAKVERILGRELKETFYGVIGDTKRGLRHRLTHGEYFNDSDSATNFVDQFHFKIVKYFNENIFQEQLISEAVVSPHRHFFGNIETSAFFIKPKTPEARPSLRAVLADFDENDIYSPRFYAHVLDQALKESY